MVVWLILAIFAAFLEAIAVQRGVQRLEFVAKPAVMVFLFIWLFTSTNLQGMAFWFGLGILFSLVGDVVLLGSSDKMFVIGWASFLVTHLFYLVGLKEQLFNLSAWSFILLFLLFSNGIRLLRKMVGVMRTKRRDALVTPVIVYSLVISLMLYAALSTIFDPEWETSAAFFVSVGAFLFYISDLILAWNKFVSPIRNGRVFNIIAYHLGQIGLIAGVISQLG